MEHISPITESNTLDLIFQELEHGYSDSDISLDLLYPIVDAEEVREVDLLINELLGE